MVRSKTCIEIMQQSRPCKLFLYRTPHLDRRYDPYSVQVSLLEHQQINLPNHLSFWEMCFNS